VLRLTLKKCFKAFNLENDIRPGNELLTDRHRAAARWLPTTVLHPTRRGRCRGRSPPPKTYESNFFYHDFMQIGKQHWRL